MENNDGNNRVNFSAGMKVNLGNYESLDVHASISRDVFPGESTRDVMELLVAEVVRTLSRAAAGIEAGKGAIALRERRARTGIEIDYKKR